MRKLSSLIMALVWLVIAVILILFALNKINIKNAFSLRHESYEYNSGKTMNVKYLLGNDEKKFNVPYNQVKEIDIDFSSEEVMISSSSRDDIYIEYIGDWSDNILPIVDMDNSTLNITKKQESNFRGNFLRSRSVAIELPKNMQAVDLNLNISSGSVHIEDLNLIEADLRLSSGSLLVEDSNISIIHAKASSGRIGFDNLKANEGFFETSSGSIKIDKSKVEKATSKSSSGSINLVGDFAEVNSHSTSGSIHITSNSILTGDSTLSSTSGSVYLKLPKESVYNLNYSTTSGSLHANNRNYGKNGILSSNDDAIDLSIQTTSGSIYIE